ncbi:MAG: FHA domain-containing protein [Planctomycetota bacterium]
MVIKFFCACGKKVSLPEAGRDASGTCPRCGQPMLLRDADPALIQRVPMLAVDIDGTEAGAGTRRVAGRERRPVPAATVAPDGATPAAGMPPVTMAAAGRAVPAPAAPPPPDHRETETPPGGMPAVAPRMRDMANPLESEKGTDEINAAAVQSSIVAAQREHFDEHAGTRMIMPAAAPSGRDRAGTDALDTSGTGTGTAGVAGGTGRLLFKAPGQAAQVVYTLGSVCVIGRAADADIPLQAEGISRRHCRVVRDGDSYHIEDTGSRNGVRVNGKKIDRARLIKGDKVLIGRAVLLFLENAY